VGVGGGFLRRRTLYLLLAGLLGGAVAVVPAIATGSTPDASFTASDYHWYVSGSTSTQATIPVGGTVDFSYPTGYSTHNADFSGTQPSCSQTAGTSSGTPPPLPKSPTGPGWSGTCTFNTAGTYTFYCDHHPYMTGTIVVGNGGTTTTTTPPTTTTTPPTTTTTTPTTTGTTPTSPTTPGSGPAPSPLAGIASKAVTISATQKGSVVRGAADISAAGAGGTLEVDLLVSKTALHGAADASAALAGRRVLRSVQAGVVKFSVPLSAGAKRSLKRRKRLTVTVELTLSSPHTSRVQITRLVHLHA
jgi:plastocyanin